MRTVTIGIGLPGSGKTTALKKFAARDRTYYISVDDLRKEKTGNANDQSRNSEVWAITYQLIHAALDLDRDVVIDATNAKKPDRIKLIAHCRQKADRIIWIWFTPSYEVCLLRNQNRDRVVPDFPIGLMAGWLEAHPPALSEGFDQLRKFVP